ncbi:hypothetical protein QFZ35_001044 [Arthrobacter ulcerisalmonis]|nr:hypothetical protein [Arthrobacter ulcerisalmonis]MDQ0662546.1 hypothetical protein [Arthrobacter ulcerisalmonis]
MESYHKVRKSIVPMTSVMDSNEAGEATQPWAYYLTVVGEQASIALRHLLAVWDLEGEPADINVWADREQIDSGEVWSHLQGSMFAGIVLARLLDPRLAAISRKANANQRERHGRRQEFAASRAEALRTLLNVDPESQLLQIRKVRDSLEHFDERIDDLFLTGDVASVSDFHIAFGGQFLEVSADDALNGGHKHRHVTLRQFAPELGLLFFGSDSVDLFAYVAALHGLLAAMPDAYEGIAPSSITDMSFGASRVGLWDEELASARREAIVHLRRKVREDGKWLLRPATRPRTVMAVWESPDPDLPANP